MSQLASPDKSMQHEATSASVVARMAKRRQELRLEAEKLRKDREDADSRFRKTLLGRLLSRIAS